MPCSLRPWTTTGIVLTGVGLVAATPVNATAPRLDVEYGSVDFAATDNPFPMVDWTQFSANATTNWDALLNDLIAPGYTPDFSGLSNPAFYALDAMLIEGGMAVKILLSPSAAGQALTGTIDNISAAIAAGNWSTAFADLGNAIPTFLNGYLNGIPPTDGLLNSISGSTPPYESGNLLAMLVQTITDQSHYLGGDHSLVQIPLADWAGSVSPDQTAGDLYLDIPTALNTLLTGPLQGLASYLGLRVSGSDLDMDIAVALNNLISAGGPLNGLAQTLGLTVSVPNDTLNMDLQTAIDSIWKTQPSWFSVNNDGNVLLDVCGSGNALVSWCSKTFGSWPVTYTVQICNYLPVNECPTYTIDIGNPTFNLTANGEPITLINFGAPASVLVLGNDYMGDVPQYDIDLAKDLLALMGAPTNLTFDLDINSVLPSSLGLMIAGGDDLHVDVANVLAELLYVFFPST